MHEEPINKGYSNRIFTLGIPTTEGSNVEIVGGIKKQFIEFEFEPHINNDFITVKTTSRYMEKSDSGDIEHPIIKDVCYYRLVKDHDITTEELYFIVQTSTSRLIHYFENANSTWKKNRLIPNYLDLMSLKFQLENLSKDLNI